jgi:hypothetical protein
MKLYISKYSSIRDQQIVVDNNIVFQQDIFINFADFIKAAYKESGISYPKFYKMDSLSKLAFVAAEVLLKETTFLTRFSKEEIGVVIANATSTITTDTEFQGSIDERANYFPSPTIFVYTLPNIAIGEICIRNKIFGENCLLVQEKFDAAQLIEYVNGLFSNGKVKACITGWADINEKQEYHTTLMLVEKEGKTAFDQKNILNIHNNGE